jgi:hypothetical protein
MILYPIVLLSYHCLSSGRMELPMLYDHIITVDFLLSCLLEIPLYVQQFSFSHTHNIFLVILKAADTQVISDYNITSFCDFEIWVDTVVLLDLIISITFIFIIVKQNKNTS